MKRLNPNTQKPFKHGDVREDGYVFLAYVKTKIKSDKYFSEKWANKSRFEVKLANTRIRVSKWAKNNKDRKNANKRKSDKNNTDRVLAKTSLRRTSKLQRTPPWLTAEQKSQIISIYKKSIELFKQTGIKHHVDHIVPLRGKTVSGLHVPWNLQILTASENCSKSNKF